MLIRLKYRTFDVVQTFFTLLEHLSNIFECSVLFIEHVRTLRYFVQTEMFEEKV
jgi:hypothetical protein